MNQSVKATPKPPTPFTFKVGGAFLDVSKPVPPILVVRGEVIVQAGVGTTPTGCKKRGIRRKRKILASKRES